ncbi:MAG: carboxypeptidase regulatory-like domain-containing protein [Cytophagales bacterium]|nr:carboxypeptidase regulatory-like domain-containing protein [Cytophagales bacterium]
MKRVVLLASIFMLCSAFVGMQEASKIIKTQLFVTVVDDIGNAQVGATVTLYPTKEDYENKTNGIGPKKTNKKGKVRFLGLDQSSYYVYAKKGKKDNLFKGEKVENLSRKKMNRVSIVIE